MMENKNDYHGYIYNGKSNLGDTRHHCRRLSSKQSSNILRAFKDVFMNPTLGSTTLLLFAHGVLPCVSTFMRQSAQFPSYFLQTEYDGNNAGLHWLSNEIGKICNPNVGFHARCSYKQDSRYAGQCMYQTRVFYPEAKYAENIKGLNEFKNTPVQIDGFITERQSNYQKLVLKLENMKIQKIMRELKTYPTFVTPKLIDGSNHFLNLKLRDIFVPMEYRRKFERHRGTLAALVTEFVNHCFDDYNLFAFMHEIIGTYRVDFEVARHISLLFTPLYVMLGYSSKSNNIVRGFQDRLLGELVSAVVKIAPNGNVSLESIGDSDAGLTDNQQDECRDILFELKKHFGSFSLTFGIKKVKAGKDRFIIEIVTTGSTAIADISRRLRDVLARMESVKTLFFDDTSDVLRLIASKSKLESPRLVEMFRDESVVRLVEKCDIPFVAGMDCYGEIVVDDISKMPHMKIGGSSGNGKSIFLHCIVSNIVRFCSPDKVQLILMDTLGDTFTKYSGIPHLYPGTGIITDPEECVATFHSLYELMQRRYAMSAEERAKQVKVVVALDEQAALYGSLEKKEGAELNKTLALLLAQARKAGLHMIFATQHPKSENLGRKFSNFNAQLSFRTDDNHDSRAIIGVSGAQHLTGPGHALYRRVSGKLVQMQCCYINDRNDEIDEFLSSLPEYGNASADRQCLPIPTRKAAVDEKEELLARVIYDALGHSKYAVNRIRHKFTGAHESALDLMEQLEAIGIVGCHAGTKPREVLIKSYEDLMPDTVVFLDRYGYTEERIRDALNTKKSIK